MPKFNEKATGSMMNSAPLKKGSSPSSKRGFFLLASPLEVAALFSMASRSRPSSEFLGVGGSIAFAGCRKV